MKRIIAAMMVVAMLACFSAASAGNAGTSSDPLVTLSYINDEYIPSVLAQAEEMIEKGSSVVSTEDGYYNFSSGYTAFVFPDGETVKLVTGSSIVVIEGTMKISSISGTVVDVSTGSEVSAGTKLKTYERYFCVEDTTAVIEASSGSIGALNGYYAVSSGVTPLGKQYSDVSVSSWYYSAVMYVYDNQLFHDYDASSFRPEDATTRAELVYALWMASGSDTSAESAQFSDISEDWYTQAVNWAAENGIILGYEDGTFRPWNSITRQEIATVMYRFAGYMGHSTSARSTLSGYTDADTIGSWALEAMKWANAEGIIIGTSETTLEPEGTATRSQVATIVMRYIEQS